MNEDIVEIDDMHTLINKVTAMVGVERETVSTIVQCFVREMTGTISRGAIVQIDNFGEFQARVYKPRKVKLIKLNRDHPEKKIIVEKKVTKIRVSFRKSIRLRDKIRKAIEGGTYGKIRG